MMRILLPLLFISVWGCSQNSQERTIESKPIDQAKLDTLQTAYFAAGCFWCVEAIFESIEGVEEVISGYAGGEEKNPTYRQVSAGATGHAESVKIYYDSTKVSYQTLLEAFFGSHDPTTLNQQGPDKGKQYRSVIFYQTENEKKLAENYIAELLKKGTFNKITTEVVSYTGFYNAEDYHQNYEENNPDNPYVQRVSFPD